MIVALPGLFSYLFWIKAELVYFNFVPPKIASDVRTRLDARKFLDIKPGSPIPYACSYPFQGRFSLAVFVNILLNYVIVRMFMSYLLCFSLGTVVVIA